MALEYMMAFFLLTKQTDKVAQYIPVMYEYGYEELPLAIRQGLIVHKLAKGEKFDLSVYDISAAEFKNAKDFFEAINSYSFQYNGDFRAKMIDQNKDSYYYYHAFF